MGLANVRQFAERIYGSQLAKTLRYRCLLIQSGDVALLKELSIEISDVVKMTGSSVVVLHSSELFDADGAMSCSKLMQIVENEGSQSCLIVLGPLTFLDYWSHGIRRTFWEFLAAFTRGPGVILCDSLRDHDFEDAFRVQGKIPGTDIRFLKSRLAATQDGLV
jgi:hypothetical protein